MIYQLAAFAGAFAIAALTDLLTPGASPRPIGWAATLAAAAVLSYFCERRLRDRPRRLVRLAALFAAHAAILYPLGWAGFVLYELGWNGRLLQSLLLLVLPASLLGLGAAPWIYLAELPRSAASRPAFGPWLGESARAFAAPLAVVVVLAGGADYLSRWPRAAALLDVSPTLAVGCAAAALLILIAASPFLILLGWSSRALPPGPLRDRVAAIAARAGLKLRPPRVWGERTRFTLNACAAGLVPGTRRIFFTRGILEHLGPDELTAVFGHEAAHFARRHMSAYAAFACAFILSLGPVDAAAGFLPWYASTSAFLLYCGAAWGPFFMALSRAFEREADLSAAALGDAGAYLGALNRLALILGAAVRQAGWRHPSVEERMRLIIEAGSDTRLAAAVFARARWLRRAVLLFFIAVVCAFSWQLAREIGRPVEEAAILRARAALERAAALESILDRRDAAGDRTADALHWIARPSAALNAERRALREMAHEDLRRAEESLPGEAAEVRAELEGGGDR